MTNSNNPSRAREFYEKIVNSDNPASFLQELITKQKPENDFLEFKGGGKIAERQVKEYWSQALSGFANTEGGVLIWGIRANRIKSPDDPSRGIDSASELDLVPNPEHFSQLLKDVRLEAVVDPIQGMECHSYISDEGSGAGFVVCLIPEGLHKPYRAAIAIDKQYYQRIGDSFTVIPHALLRSLFYPQTSPDLVLEVVLESFGEIDASLQPPDRLSKYRFRAHISNLGTASGQDIYISAKTNYAAKWFGQDCFKALTDDGAFLFTRPLHPNEQAVGCFSCHVTAPTHLQFQAGKTIPMQPDRIVFDIGIYARDAAPVQVQLTFLPSEIGKMCAKTTRLNEDEDKEV